MTTADELVLAGSFPTPTKEDWDKEVLKVMNRKRAPGTELTIEQAIKRLTTVTVDGVSIEPLYTKPENQVVGFPGQVPFARGSELPDPEAPWVVEQLHEDPNAARTNGHVLDDLNRGGTGVWLRVDADAIAAGDVAKALAGVVPGAADISVSSIAQQDEAAAALLAFLDASGKATEATGNLGIDPIGSAAVTGAPADVAKVVEWVKKAQGYGKLRTLVVDVRPYDNAGAGDIQQLAYAIATGIEYVRALTDAGISAEDAFGQITFRVAVSANQFPTIARLRALRVLWNRVGEVLGVPEAARGAIQHTVTSWRILTKTDPWVNLLRETVSTFSAAVGGAEVITVLPHDTAYGLPTSFSRRIARNIQLVSFEEAHLGATKDQAGGAWFVESLTAQLAEKAWAVVQTIEAAGGQSAALAAGLIAEQLAPVNAERNKRIATRQLSITGTSQFPKPDEAIFTDFEPRPAAPAYAGLPAKRDSEVFEGLRQQVRDAKAAGKNPEVLLACLGERRDFGGREGFTSNVLWIAELGVPEIEGGTPEEIVAKAQALGAKVVVLASSAKVYADQAIPAAKALKDAGVAHVWIAGRKTETGAADVDEYIEGEIFDGMNVVDFLATTLKNLEVAK
ncbi:MAG: methylmalonyl-CoA mutase family protein [Propionibacteriaceae bacterium]|jgi:methylmalonyl-CoA mutase|nr:methylmalonyl-CoA mutase family protein [Propionibacteriaceae bacterium]